ncbi:hypothetical protein [Rhodococcus opacus]|uniref:Uncharacterized protein n=1 Tax=Rhodococcus opacus (strain B4) TaxID=632772 RepID=C1B9A8_RHOOB|nr:hypothetical protein [Rhodococcus opacus]BAH52261.1 hypothetical protein ROP_40140 [Rhodococcus opacus B4]
MTELSEAGRAHYELWKWARAEQARLKTIETNARAALETEIGGDAEAVVDGAPVISWTPVKSSKFDQSAFAKDHPDLFEQYKRTSESRPFKEVKQS